MFNTFDSYQWQHHFRTTYERELGGCLWPCTPPAGNIPSALKYKYCIPLRKNQLELYLSWEMDEYQTMCCDEYIENRAGYLFTRCCTCTCQPGRISSRSLISRDGFTEQARTWVREGEDGLWQDQEKLATWLARSYRQALHHAYPSVRLLHLLPGLNYHLRIDQSMAAWERKKERKIF